VRSSEGGASALRVSTWWPRRSREKGASLFIYDSSGTLERGTQIDLRVFPSMERVFDILSTSYSPDGM